MEIKDMNVGETVYCNLSGNAARGKNREDLIQEWEIVSIGKKYVVAKKKGEFSREYKFEIQNGYKQNTNYCVDYVLYATKQEILDKYEKEELTKWIRDYFSGYGKVDCSLEVLRKIKDNLTKDKHDMDKLSPAYVRGYHNGIQDVLFNMKDICEKGEFDYDKITLILNRLEKEPIMHADYINFLKEMQTTINLKSLSNIALNLE